MKHLLTWIWLALIWLAGNISDRLWLALDKTVPSWDQSNHLTGSLNYLQALQNPEFLNGSWWINFWRLSSKYPPLTYLFSVPFQQLLSKGNDQAIAANFLSSAILIISVYYLGKTLFNSKVGVISALLCILFPRLYLEKLVYLTDNLLVSLTTASFTSLTLWRGEKDPSKQWLYSAVFGCFWGLALLTKQSVMFFLLVPLIWVSCRFLLTRQWLRILQLLTSFLISAFFWWPWYRTNWIYSFGTYTSSVILPAAAEGDPTINSLAAWLYYWRDLPLAISWVLLLVPLVGIILNLLGRFPKTEQKEQVRDSLAWLAIYWLGSYIVCTLNVNKDGRYILPYLPILAVFLAYGLTQWRGNWQKIQVATVSIAVLVMLGKLYPLPVLTQVAQFLSPGGTYYPYRGQPWPDEEVIKTITETTPYLQATLGVIPSTPEINHNTLNYYGALANFKVYGRELGSKPEAVEQDRKSLDWFLTKTGDNLFTKKTQLELGQELERDPDFSSVKTWTLPDQSSLKLYHRKTPLVTVQTISEPQEKISLKEVIVPAVVPPNTPIPVTYHWVGKGQELKNGLVLINWEKDTTHLGWIQDHALGMGEIHQASSETLEVTEQTAMLSGKEEGEYHLRVTYINPQNGTSYPVKVPSVTVKTVVGATIPQAPVLDKVTQLNSLSHLLSKGPKALDPLFLQVGRLNQYDPKQDYLEQTAQTLSYRLEKENLDLNQRIKYLYGVILARVLQEDTSDAIIMLQKLIELEPKNPYPHAYLAVVYLYNWDSASAETAFKPLFGTQEHSLRILQGIIAILRGHLLEGISLIKSKG